MQKIQILIVGTNKPIMETIARLIDKEEKWLATIAYAVEDAVQLCSSKDFALALIGGGLTAQEEIKLRLKLAEIKPKLPVVNHYGGGSGLLFAEIFGALGNY